MNMKNVLVVAAHPDDDILGCGGTIAKYTKLGIKFKVIFIAEGTTCRFATEEINSENALKEIEKRNTYAKKSLEVLGVKEFTFYNLPCGRLDQEPIIEIGKIIEKEIKEFKPDTIFTHSNIDVNNDHLRVFQGVLQATRVGALNFVNQVYSFEILSSSEWRFVEAFKPNVFISLDKEHIDLKIKSLNEYVSEIKEFPFPRSNEGLEILAKRRGMQIGKKYAESFSLVREVI